MKSEKDEGKAEKALKNLGKKIDEFVAELKQAGERMEKEFEDRYEELRKSAEKLRQEATDKERWKEVEESLKRAGKELEHAMKTAFSKRNK
ncbi:MAG: hypothetical protein N2044_03410 [Cyclobacteriaceae bacterium]|nr:hypothetical protein [Cyclobacteriaceae bacterium]MCX7636874.1 hypothetical protein [Cyclobacteriaceae bacterium]MDW8330240.1 hypothetical protein [Cyclobacteriaceae bacterium]